MSSDFSVKSISGIFAYVGFIADVLALFIFIKSMLSNEASLQLESVLSSIVVIIGMFGISLLFVLVSREKDEKPIIFMLFGWVYIILSAAFFGGISLKFIVNGNYSIEYWGFILIVFLIAILGDIVSSYSGEKPNFSIPFMAVALEIALLLFWRVFLSGLPNKFDLIQGGNIALFVFAGILIVYFNKE